MRAASAGEELELDTGLKIERGRKEGPTARKCLQPKHGLVFQPPPLPRSARTTNHLPQLFSLILLPFFLPCSLKYHFPLTVCMPKMKHRMFCQGRSDTSDYLGAVRCCCCCVCQSLTMPVCLCVCFVRKQRDCNYKGIYIEVQQINYLPLSLHPSFYDDLSFSFLPFCHPSPSIPFSQSISPEKIAAATRNPEETT